MGLIICTEKGKDEFVYWSTIADGPMAFGTREQVREEIKFMARRDDEYADERFDRAAELGSSMAPGASGMPLDHQQEGWWSDSGFIYDQKGWLYRDRLGEFCRRYFADDEAGAIELLVSFDEANETTRVELS